MTDPQPFQWAYDRSAWDDRPYASTFSVGVFQWLPKAAGGLKKSTSIRVNGYVADADAVYAKADELCERLNREGTRLDARPPWLQKSYSIAKPVGIEKPRRSAELTAAEVRAVRNRVVKPLARSAGYEQIHASTFARRRDEFVQLMHFQTLTWGPKFTVNLGWHPTFVPILGDQPKRRPWTEIEEYRCTLRGRIGRFLPAQLDTWWDFGADADALATTFVDLAEQAIDILDRAGSRFRRWCERPSDRAFNLAPQVHIGHLIRLRACIDMRAGRLDEATSRLQSALAADHGGDPGSAATLLRHVDLLRAAIGNPVKTANLLTWLTV